MRSANEAQAVGAFEIDAGEDDNPESTGTEEEVRCADGLLVAARADEQGPSSQKAPVMVSEPSIHAARSPAVMHA